MDHGRPRAGSGVLFSVISSDSSAKRDKESGSVILHHGKGTVWYLESDLSSYHCEGGYRGIMVSYA